MNPRKMDKVRKKAEESFNSEAEFNVWLRQLTENEREHIIDMMADFHQSMIGDFEPSLPPNGQSLTQAEAGACVEGLATSVCYPPCS